MRAFHNDPVVQARYLNRVRQHFLADQITQGIYWLEGKGCAVGCTIHSGSHSRYPRLLGIPMELAHLEDALFEYMGEDHIYWPSAFLEAIPLGADLSNVGKQFIHWLITDSVYGARVAVAPARRVLFDQTLRSVLDGKLVVGIPSDMWDARRIAVCIKDNDPREAFNCAIQRFSDHDWYRFVDAAASKLLCLLADAPTEE